MKKFLIYSAVLGAMIVSADVWGAVVPPPPPPPPLPGVVIEADSASNYIREIKKAIGATDKLDAAAKKGNVVRLDTIAAAVNKKNPKGVLEGKDIQGLQKELIKKLLGSEPPGRQVPVVVQEGHPELVQEIKGIITERREGVEGEGKGLSSKTQDVLVEAFNEFLTKDLSVANIKNFTKVLEEQIWGDGDSEELILQKILKEVREKKTPSDQLNVIKKELAPYFKLYETRVAKRKGQKELAQNELKLAEVNTRDEAEALEKKRIANNYFPNFAQSKTNLWDETEEIVDVLDFVVERSGFRRAFEQNGMWDWWGFEYGIYEFGDIEMNFEDAIAGMTNKFKKLPKDNLRYNVALLMRQFLELFATKASMEVESMINEIIDAKESVKDAVKTDEVKRFFDSFKKEPKTEKEVQDTFNKHPLIFQLLINGIFNTAFDRDRLQFKEYFNCLAKVKTPWGASFTYANDKIEMPKFFSLELPRYLFEEGVAWADKRQPLASGAKEAAYEARRGKLDELKQKLLASGLISVPHGFLCKVGNDLPIQENKDLGFHVFTKDIFKPVFLLHQSWRENNEKEFNQVWDSWVKVLGKPENRTKDFAVMVGQIVEMAQHNKFPDRYTTLLNELVKAGLMSKEARDYLLLPDEEIFKPFKEIAQELLKLMDKKPNAFDKKIREFVAHINKISSDSNVYPPARIRYLKIENIINSNKNLQDQVKFEQLLNDFVAQKLMTKECSNNLLVVAGLKPPAKPIKLVKTIIPGEKGN